MLNKLYFPHIGGIEKFVQDLACLLKAEGYNVKVLVANSKGPTKKEVIDGVEVVKTSSLGIYLSMPLSLSYPIYLKKMSQWADIIHIHLPYPLGVLSYFLIRPKKPIIVSWHSDIIRQRYFLFFYKRLLFWFLKRVRLIVPHTYNLVYSSSFLPYFFHKVKPIPIWITPSENVQGIESLREKYAKRVVLFVGRFVYYKGIYYLLEAMKGVEGICILIGGGRERNKIQETIRENNLSHKVVLISGVSNEELRAYYSIADVFVLPSIYNSEAYGLVLLEAMYHNTPIVTFNLPTGVSFVNDGVSRGIRVPYKDIEGLRDAINELLNNKSKNKKKGIWGKRWVDKIFRERFRYLDIYKD